MTLLEISDLHVRYGRGGHAVDGATFSLEQGKTALILGPNGAGKTSLVRGIAGFLRREGVKRTGSVRLNGQETIGWQPDAIARAGVCYIPEQGKVFAGLTVAENLSLFAERRKNRAGAAEDTERALDLFPAIRKLLKRHAGLLSGGERQMVALSGGVISASSLLIVDEPSQGLAPIVVGDVIEALDTMRRELGLAILMVDQNMRSTIRIADDVYLMASGELTTSSREEVEEQLSHSGYGGKGRAALRAATGAE